MRAAADSPAQPQTFRVDMSFSYSESLYEGGGANRLGKDEDSDIDNLDFDNFKGIYFDEDPNRKY